MTKEAAKTAVALTGGLYVAPKDTPRPTVLADAPDAALWTELGWLQVDGPVLSDQKTTSDIRAWPGNNIIRSLLDERTTGITGEVLQIFDNAVWQMMMAGGTFTAGVWTPDETELIQAVCLDIEDGPNKLRIHAHAAKNAASLEVGFPSNDLAGGAIDLRFQQSGAEKLFSVESNLW